MITNPDGQVTLKFHPDGLARLRREGAGGLVSSRDLLRRHTLMALAGPVIDARSSGGNAGLAEHESGHSVLGHILGLEIAEVSIQRSVHCDGHVTFGKPPADGLPLPMSAEKPLTDRQQISRYCYLAAPDVHPLRWRSCLVFYRELRAEAAALVIANWDVIWALATELLPRGFIGGTEATATITELLAAKRAYDAGEQVESSAALAARCIEIAAIVLIIPCVVFAVG
jgi:hypothetical protein